MDRDRTEASLRVDIRHGRLTLILMVVRICLLVLLAVAVATGCVAPADGPNDRQAELVEIGVEEAVVARTAELLRPVRTPVPLLERGTEVEYPSPSAARVFRPPRVAMG